MPFPKLLLKPQVIAPALIAILVLVGAGLYFLYFNTKKTEAIYPCPVPKEYCKTAEEIPGDKALGFRLPEGTEIKAVINGDARELISSWGDIVIELRSNSGSGIFYIFQSENHISFNAPVEVGFVLGKSGEVSKLHKNYNLVIRIVDEKSNYLDKVKSFFEN